MQAHPVPHFLIVLLIGFALSLTACGDDNKGTGDNDASTDTVLDQDGDAPDDIGDDGDAVDPPAGELCVAVRGNGSRLFAHFGALARIHEHYGLIGGMAGGSSASITTFISESMYANQWVWDCGEAECTPEESAARIALMYKSMEGYLVVLQGTDEAFAFSLLAPLLEKANEEGVGALFEEGNLEQGREALQTLLESPEVADLVNDEVLDLISNSPNALFHAEQVWEHLSGFGSFSVDSDIILIRPGILDFSILAEKIGRIGTFYAAYGNADEAAWQQFFEGCADTPGMTWDQIAAQDAGNGMTCGEHFVALGRDYRTDLVANEDTAPNRIDDNVGSIFKAFIITSVMTGDAVSEWNRARELYIQAEDYGVLDVSFDDVQFGYWGQQADLDTVASNPMGYADEKTSRYLSLGEAPYADALSFSPAEPGLARALEIDDGLVSAGGWPDLEPVLVLKNSGCDEVVLVTRQGDVRGFGWAVANLLGMTELPAVDAGLYDLTPGDSSSYLSLEEADGIWCTNWDAVGGFDFVGTSRDGYAAPLESEDPFFVDGGNAYSNVSADLGLVGCTPGVAQ